MAPPPDCQVEVELWVQHSEAWRVEEPLYCWERVGVLASHGVSSVGVVSFPWNMVQVPTLYQVSVAPMDRGGKVISFLLVWVEFGLSMSELSVSCTVEATSHTVLAPTLPSLIQPPGKHWDALLQAHRGLKSLFHIH